MKKTIQVLLTIFLLMGIGIALPVSQIIPGNSDSLILKAEAKKKKKKKKKKKSTKSANIAPIILSGTGANATQQFVLQKGISISEFSHTGGGYFGVWLMDSKGDNVDLLANEVGNCSGKKAVGIGKSENYLLNVEAEGDWSVTITQPRPTSGVQKPTTFNGKGNDVSQFLYFKKKGLVRFSMSHDGEGYFGIWLMDSNGKDVSLLANAVGSFNGSKAVKIPKKGVYLLNVEADGNWSISVN